VRTVVAVMCLVAGAAAVTLPAAAGPTRAGAVEPAFFVGGRFGEVRILALDVQGRIVASGEGKGGPYSLIAPCPGGERLAEVVHRRSDRRMRASYELAIRETRSLRVVRRLSLRLPGWRFAVGLQCETASGSSVVIFANWAGDSALKAAMYRLTGRRLTTIWKGTAFLSSLAPGIAYLNSGFTAARLVGVDLRTGRVARIAWLPRSPMVAPDPTGTWLAGVAYRLAEPSRLVLIDARVRPARWRSLPLAGPEVFGSVVWLPDGTLLLSTSDSGFARVLDRDLRVLSRFRWTALDTTLVGSTVYGIRPVRRTLVAAPVPTGPMRMLRRLPGTPQVLVAAAG
jgi:hypothetical protein